MKSEDNICTDSLHAMQPCKATFDLISKLLAEVMVDCYEGIIVNGRQEHFFYDPEIQVKSNGAVALRISNFEITEEDSRMEIALSGSFEKGLDGRFHLRFVMNSLKDIVPPRASDIDQIVGRAILLNNLHCDETYYDSLFNLSLNHVQRDRTESFLGKGRGYFFIIKD